MRFTPMLVLRAGAVVGIACAAGGVGYLVGTHGAHRPIVVTAAPRGAAGVPTAGTAVMPSLNGLTQDAALAALALVRVPAGSVTVTVRPAATTPGVIVGQSPAAGAVVDTKATVTLLISGPGTMPDLVGKSETEARAALQALGAQVTTNGVFAEGRTPGTVIAESPTAGAPLTETTALTVAAAPSSVFLSALRPVSSNCSTSSSESVNGTALSDSVICQVAAGNTATADYVLNRHVSTLTMTAGQRDRSPTGFVMNLQVLADGQQVVGQRIVFGTATISVPVDGVLRLSVRVTTEAQQGVSMAPTVVLGSAKLIGAPAAIDLLLAESKGN